MSAAFLVLAMSKRRVRVAALENVQHRARVGVATQSDCMTLRQRSTNAPPIIEEYHEHNFTSASV